MTKTKKQKLGPLQRKWLRELRSGKYKQTTGVLHKIEQNGHEKHSFCCLGIACEKVLKLSCKPLPELGSGEEYEVSYIAGTKADEDLIPGKAWLALGLRTNGGEADNASTSDALYELNDGGKSFKEIANIIERNPSRYFTKPL